MTPASILHDLIAISSVSSESNVPVIRYAQSVLARFDWIGEEQAYTDEHGIAKVNDVAWPRSRPPVEGRSELALVCHTDTVPYDWPGATQPFEKDGQIFGRGACDVKGSLASALCAVRDATGPVCLVLTAEEKLGAWALSAWWPRESFARVSP